MKIKTMIFATTVMLSSSLLAEQIVLSDGSTIQGKVLSMNNGQYQVQTGSMGVISVPQNQVRSISGSASSSTSQLQSRDQAGASTVQAIQSTMTSDPGIMSSIMQLQHNPDMKAVLNDPEVMQAVQSFDLETLANHPKIKKLMQNSQIRSIQGKVN